MSPHHVTVPSSSILTGLTGFESLYNWCNSILFKKKTYAMFNVLGRSCLYNQWRIIMQAYGVDKGLLETKNKLTQQLTWRIAGSCWGCWAGCLSGGSKTFKSLMSCPRKTMYS